MAGNFPLPTGRYTSARRTTPSSMRMGASQSIRMLSRISFFVDSIRTYRLWWERTALRPVTLHRIGIGGIRAHIDAAFPFSLQRIGDFQTHLADVLDFDFHRFSILQRAQTLVIGAACDEIAGVHGHHRGGVFYEFWHAMFHVVGIIVVAELAVIPEPHDQIVGILDLVRRGDARADRRESVERFSQPAGERAGRPGFAALFAR